MSNTNVANVFSSPPPRTLPPLTEPVDNDHQASADDHVELTSEELTALAGAIGHLPCLIMDLQEAGLFIDTGTVMTICNDLGQVGCITFNGEEFRYLPNGPVKETA